MCLSTCLCGYPTLQSQGLSITVAAVASLQAPLDRSARLDDLVGTCESVCHLDGDLETVKYFKDSCPLLGFNTIVFVSGMHNTVR